MIVVKVLLRMVARGAEQIYAHKVSSAIVALLVIALAFVSTAKFSEPGPAQASFKAGAQPAATANYFKGQETFNSDLIWSGLSQELIDQAAIAGATKQDLQDQLDSARDSGRFLQEVSYIGGHELRKGGSMQFYVATIRSDGLSSEVDEIFYVFTLDNQGKIVSIE